jgi:hypothetical protein
MGRSDPSGGIHEGYEPDRCSPVSLPRRPVRLQPTDMFRGESGGPGAVGTVLAALGVRFRGNDGKEGEYQGSIRTASLWPAQADLRDA